jgi:hypothetical protein
MDKTTVTKKTGNKNKNFVTCSLLSINIASKPLYRHERRLIPNHDFLPYNYKKNTQIFL